MFARTQAIEHWYQKKGILELEIQEMKRRFPGATGFIDDQERLCMSCSPATGIVVKAVLSPNHPLEPPAVFLECDERHSALATGLQTAGLYNPSLRVLNVYAIFPWGSKYCAAAVLDWSSIILKIASLMLRSATAQNVPGANVAEARG